MPQGPEDMAREQIDRMLVSEVSVVQDSNDMVLRLVK